MTIGIFPASGGLGGSTYEHLLKLVAPSEVVLISRHPEKVPQKHSQAGVQLRQASYESTPAELEQAFVGIDTLFLISYPSHVYEYRVKVQLPAVDAARRAGVKHIFYSSLAFAGLNADKSLAEVMQAHLDTEKYLARAAEVNPSATYTSIREGLYSESTPIYTAFFNPKDPGDSNEILIPHDGNTPGISWVKKDELGEASAKLIAQYVASPNTFPLVNKTITLTGVRSWTLAETVDVLGKVTGKSLRIKQVSVDEYANLPQVTARFGSRDKALTWATAWEAIRAGETAHVTDDLERVLGRKPEDFETTVRKHWA
ncbi:NAD(P)-binding protein [Thozetella sp. PMI_491]|nr:NAD(P)-binding protein [Thozetella sp. PMI_491]